MNDWMAAPLELTDAEISRARARGITLEAAEQEKASELGRRYGLTSEQVRAAAALDMPPSVYAAASSATSVDDWARAQANLTRERQARENVELERARERARRDAA